MTAYAAPAQAFRPARPAAPRLVMIDSPVARRRRRTLAVLVLAVVVAIVGPRAVAGDEPTTPVLFDTYTVAAGETLWSIASSLTPAGEDVNETVVAIKDLNAKAGSGLQTGEQLLIPALD